VIVNSSDCIGTARNLGSWTSGRSSFEDELGLPSIITTGKPSFAFLPLSNPCKDDPYDDHFTERPHFSSDDRP
jgi:hypothetical protein